MIPTIHQNCAARGLDIANGRVIGVETSAGRIETPRVVVVAGAWSASLLTPLGLDYGLAPHRIQVSIFHWPSGFTQRHPAVIDAIHKAWWRPEGRASTLIGAYVIFGILAKRLYINGATAAMLLVLAFGATAAGEFVREGARKPFTVRGVLYSTSMTPAEVEQLRVKGATTDDPYPLKDADRYANDQLRHGAKVYRALCDACHTMKGSNGITHLVATWTDDQLRLNIAKLQRTKAFMPPFAGNAQDVEAIVQLLRWELADTPATWPTSADPTALGLSYASKQRNWDTLLDPPTAPGIVRRWRYRFTSEPRAPA